MVTRNRPLPPLPESHHDLATALYESSHALVKRTVAKQLRSARRCSKECIEDVSQEALVRCVFKASLLSQLAPTQRVIYFAKAASSASIDHLRGRHHRHEPIASDQVATEVPVEHVFAVRDESEATLAAMSREDAEIVRLRYLEDLDLHAIATRLGLGISAAKSRLHRAVRKAKAVRELARAS